ncbi:MAG: ribbon-helix-helix protein, CopG family [Actinomycetota bacterium]
MTMLTFRADEVDARRLAQWADRLGLDRSKLLRDALRLHLVRLAAETDAQLWESIPLDSGEQNLSEVADWGPAEEWSDWADAQG